MNLAGMSGDLIIQILYIVSCCLKRAFHTNVSALKRYHHVSPTMYLIIYIFIIFVLLKNRDYPVPKSFHKNI